MLPKIHDSMLPNFDIHPRDTAPLGAPFSLFALQHDDYDNESRCVIFRKFKVHHVECAMQSGKTNEFSPMLYLTWNDNYRTDPSFTWLSDMENHLNNYLSIDKDLLIAPIDDENSTILDKLVILTYNLNEPPVFKIPISNCKTFDGFSNGAVNFNAENILDCFRPGDYVSLGILFKGICIQRRHRNGRTFKCDMWWQASHAKRFRKEILSNLPQSHIMYKMNDVMLQDRSDIFSADYYHRAPSPMDDDTDTDSDNIDDSSNSDYNDDEDDDTNSLYRILLRSDEDSLSNRYEGENVQMNRMHENIDIGIHRDLSTNRNLLTCSICLIEDIGYVLDCGHAYCRDCCMQLTNCAQCRSYILDRRRIYL